MDKAFLVIASYAVALIIAIERPHGFNPDYRDYLFSLLIGRDGTSCSPKATDFAFDKIRTGDSEERVREVLGAPISRIESSSCECTRQTHTDLTPASTECPIGVDEAACLAQKPSIIIMEYCARPTQNLDFWQYTVIVEGGLVRQTLRPYNID